MKKKGIGTGELVTLLLAIFVIAVLLILVVTNLDIFKRTTQESSVKTWVAAKANTGIQTSNLPSRPPTPTLLEPLYLVKEDLKAKQGERTSKANKEIADAMIQCASSFGQQNSNAKILSTLSEPGNPISIFPKN